VALNRRWASVIADRLFKKPLHWLDGRYGKERGMAKLLLKAATKFPSKRAVATFVSELETMPPRRFSVIDILCEGLIIMAGKNPGIWENVRIPLRNRLTNATRMRAFGPNVKIAAKYALKRNDVNLVIETAKKLIIEGIMSIGCILPEKLFGFVEYVKRTIMFISCICPEFTLGEAESLRVARDAREFVERFQDFDPDSARCILQFCHLPPLQPLGS
jgi:hypothetical protein